MTTTDPIPEYLERRSGFFNALINRNPIALKELRGRMRGARAFIVLSVYVLLMSVFTVILYAIYTASQQATLSTSGGAVGKLIFAGVVVIELFLVCFIAPAFTAGAISGEREKQTYDLLRTTLLPARRIVQGKLLSAMAYITLLLMVAVPLQSLAFLMGGITGEEMILSVIVLLVTAICYATVGIYFSTVTKKTLNASVLTYGFALLVTVALPLVTLVLAGFASAAAFSDQPRAEMILQYLFYALSATNPVTAGVVTEITLQQHGSIWVFTQTLSDGTPYPVLSPWIPFIVVYLGATIALITASVRQIRQIEE